jgi:hypothetical protein
MLNKHYIARLPKIELSYETILHKKVFSDIFMLIPKGNKVLAWFTYENETNICILFHLNKCNNFTKIEVVDSCFDKVLSYGTILYGTYFTCNKHNFITCEDIYYYKGENIQNTQIKYKINILNTIFKSYLQQKAYTSKFVIFGMPYMSDKIQTAYNKIKELPYEIDAVGFYILEKTKKLGNLKCTHAANETIFKIKANIEEDIYTLYCKSSHNDSTEFYGYAGVFDYKTSVFMNGHFRTIKENYNLDLLEMSDCEEEFENIKEDKFVNLKKIVYMKCKYNKKFKKWQPYEAVQFGEKLLSKKDINYLEYNY